MLPLVAGGAFDSGLTGQDDLAQSTFFHSGCTVEAHTMASACNRNRSPSSGAPSASTSPRKVAARVFSLLASTVSLVPAGARCGRRDGGARRQTFGQGDGIKGPQTARTISLSGGGVSAKCTAPEVQTPSHWPPVAPVPVSVATPSGPRSSREPASRSASRTHLGFGQDRSDGGLVVLARAKASINRFSCNLSAGLLHQGITT